MYSLILTIHLLHGFITAVVEYPDVETCAYAIRQLDLVDKNIDCICLKQEESK
jgi:hypothetical protein